VIIQDPADTPFRDMPRHALGKMHPDFLPPHKKIAASLLEHFAESNSDRKVWPNNLVFGILHEPEYQAS
jgi:hypothetical protein